MDGMLFSWADFVGGIRDFGERSSHVPGVPLNQSDSNARRSLANLTYSKPRQPGFILPSGSTMVLIPSALPLRGSLVIIPW